MDVGIMLARILWRFFRPLIFIFDSETAHRIAVLGLRIFWSFGIFRRTSRILFAPNSVQVMQKPIDLGGVVIHNPVGLAAGFDKNAELLKGIATLGFGFAEIGTVTPLPQPGNPSPRIFREVKDHALVNRMGFPNDGMNEIYWRMEKAKPFCPIPIGVNIGKNKDTPDENAAADYVTAAKLFASVADYFTINVSSPNTPGLRALQNVEFLRDLGGKLSALDLDQPIFLKLAPDIAEHGILDLSSIAKLCGEQNLFSGLVLANTLPSPEGGISGRPLKERSFQLLKIARQIIPKPVPIISVGGIETASDLRDRLNAGATAVQIYTALIYDGPGIVTRILND